MTVKTHWVCFQSHMYADLWIDPKKVIGIEDNAPRDVVGSTIHCEGKSIEVLQTIEEVKKRLVE